MTINSGSPVSAISEREFAENETFSSLQLVETNRKFRSYAEDQMVPLGILKVKVEFKRKKIDTELSVMSGGSNPIVGREWTRGLDVISNVISNV